MTTDQELIANGSRALELWTELQAGRDPAEWVGKTVGVDTATREVFLGGCISDIPKRPTVVIVKISKLDVERRRLRLGGRWRRLNSRAPAVDRVTPEFTRADFGVVYRPVKPAAQARAKPPERGTGDRDTASANGPCSRGGLTNNRPLHRREVRSRSPARGILSAEVMP